MKTSPLLFAALAVLSLSACGMTDDYQQDTTSGSTERTANWGKRVVDTAPAAPATTPAPAPAPVATPEEKAPVSNAEPVFERKNSK